MLVRLGPKPTSERSGLRVRFSPEEDIRQFRRAFTTAHHPLISQHWGKAVIVENLPGADGNLAAREFVAKRDNHTLLYSFPGLITINPLMYDKLPYEPALDFSPIASTSDNFLAIAISESPANRYAGGIGEGRAHTPYQVKLGFDPGDTPFRFRRIAEARWH